MTLVKLHACQYRKVKRFPDIGDKFEREGFCLGLGPAPPVHSWRLRVPLSLRSDGRVVGDSALRPRPIGLRRDRLPGRGVICPPTSCRGASCCLARGTPNRTRSRVRLPGRLQPLVGGAAVPATIPGTGTAPARFRQAAGAAPPGAAEA